MAALYDVVGIILFFLLCFHLDIHAKAVLLLRCHHFGGASCHHEARSQTYPLLTPKPTLKISATHIGPIMSLDAPLSNNKQNLIFARNGTGKSFLARSLRLLDESSLEGVAYVFSYEEGGVIGGQSSLYKGAMS